MSREMIAVDIDDVLSASAAGFCAFSNEHYGTSLTVDDYTEHWAELWGVDNAEVGRRANHMDAEGIWTKYDRHDAAKPVLEQLHNRYRMILITSRRRATEVQSRAWVAEHYPDLFEDIHFAGIFEGDIHEGMLNRTKADLFSSSGVDYVIDDQLKHCMAAAGLGIKAVLFGDYPWNQVDELPERVTRCADWPAVMDYFDGQS